VRGYKMLKKKEKRKCSFLQIQQKHSKNHIVSNMNNNHQG